MKIKKYSPTQRLGFKGETIAQKYLEQHGLKLVTQNFYSPFGEIDLVMQDDSHVIFVEVRCRQAGQFINLVESITQQKQKRIILTAEYYLSKYPTTKSSRFDLITIRSLAVDKEIQWIINAF